MKMPKVVKIDSAGVGYFVVVVVLLFDLQEQSIQKDTWLFSIHGLE